MEVSHIVKIAEGGRLFEGPIWDPRISCLYWVDILEKSLFCWDSNSKAISCYHFEALTSAVMLTNEVGKLLVSQDRQIDIISHGKYIGTLAQFPEPNSNRLNDCKVTQFGTILAGSMEIDPVSLAGSYYQVAGDEVSCLLKNVGIANGSTDLDSNLLLTDSLQGVLYEYRKDKEGSPCKLVRSLSKEYLGGIPDGHCLDSHGNLWIALWEGCSVVKMDYSGWSILDRVKIPKKNVSSCCIGKINGELKLFVTCAETTSKKGDSAVFEISFSSNGPGNPYEKYCFYNLSGSS